MHKKSIVIFTLISVLIIGTVFGIIYKKQSDSYEYEYINNAEEKLTCAEVPDDFEYTDLMKKLAIYYYSEGLCFSTPICVYIIVHIRPKSLTAQASKT